MSTRCNIAIRKPNGTVTSIYCHYDGYLGGTGKILLKHYNSPEKAGKLMELGNIKCLMESPEEIERFNEPPTEFKNIGEYVKQAKDIMIDYIYVFDTKDNEWYWLVDRYNMFKKLKEEK